MSFPSKFTNFDQSILSKISHLIIDDTCEIELAKLIKLKLAKFNDVSELMLGLDVLFALGKIELDVNEGVIKYVN